jgi:hypothetical protein
LRFIPASNRSAVSVPVSTIRYTLLSEEISLMSTLQIVSGVLAVLLLVIVVLRRRGKKKVEEDEF